MFEVNVIIYFPFWVEPELPSNLGSSSVAGSVKSIVN